MSVGGSVAAGSVRDALAAATDALDAAGVGTPRLDAELLLAEAIGWDRARLAAEPEARIEPPAARVFGEMLRRRLRREPFAYIVGRKGFRGIELAVDRRALIPRPETELLVEVAVEIRPATVLDVGTGCGAVALAVASELPDAQVTATDTSAEALALARENAIRLGLERVRFLAGSVPDGEPFDLILANLPYVREDQWRALDPEVREWEPREAVVSGPDGLEVLRWFVTVAPSDTLALEVGMGQEEQVAELLRGAGYGKTETRRDLAGIERVVVSRR